MHIVRMVNNMFKNAITLGQSIFVLIFADMVKCHKNPIDLNMSKIHLIMLTSWESVKKLHHV